MESVKIVNTSLRIVAEYQLMSERNGHEWMTDALNSAKKSNLVDDFAITGVHVGNHGLQLITFTVDVALRDDGLFNPDMEYDVALEAAEVLLNAIVHDTDVNVRWISPQQ